MSSLQICLIRFATFDVDHFLGATFKVNPFICGTFGDYLIGLFCNSDLKLFLLHIGTILLSSDQANNEKCSSLMYLKNSKEILMSHNEDAGKFMANNIFIVDAEILDENGAVLEKWTSVTYAGYLPGGTSGYNVHGVLHSMNTLVPRDMNQDGTPVLFVMRGLLSAKSFQDAQRIMRDHGAGSSDGFNINLIEFHETSPSLVVNIEGAPPTGNSKETVLDFYFLMEGESYAHCNHYLRLKVPEKTNLLSSTNRRLEVINKFPKPYDLERIIQISSDQSDKEYPIFRGNGKDLGLTVIVGIFDLGSRKWIIYSDDPSKSKPIVVLPISFEKDKVLLKSIHTDTKPVLGYWDVRGIAQPIRHILKYSNIDFEDKLYPCTKEIMLTEWNQEKNKLGLDFPNLPYFIDGNVKITESRAIIQYICRKYDPLLLPQSEDMLRKAQILEGVITDIWKMLGLACYDGDKVYLERYNELVPELIGQVSKFIGESKWCAGNEICYLDFILYEVLYHNKTYKNDLLKNYDNLERLMKNFEFLPEMLKYMNDPSYVASPCFRRWNKICI